MAFAMFAGLAILGMAAFALWRGSYYRRIYSDEHFREFHRRLSEAIERAKLSEPGTTPAVEAKTAFVTDAGLAVAVTFDADEQRRQVLHISLSQPGSATTHAVCARFGFFVPAMLSENKAVLTPTCTSSGVHHLRFTFPSREVSIREFGSCYTDYQQEYRPIPFQSEALPPQAKRSEF